MTQNALAYFQHMETQRSNKAREKETARANRAVEEETHRHNLAMEELNAASLVETSRHNQMSEHLTVQAQDIQRSGLGETIRHNFASENVAMANVGLGYAQLAELQRHQLAVETETNRTNIAKESETLRHNLAGEALEARGLKDREKQTSLTESRTKVQNRSDMLHWYTDAYDAETRRQNVTNTYEINKEANRLRRWGIAVDFAAPALLGQ